MIHHIDSGGEVTETAAADYPDEEDSKEEEEDDEEEAIAGRSLLRGPTKNSLGINLNIDTDTTIERNLAGVVEIDVLVVYTAFAMSQNCGSWNRQ